MVLSWFPLWLRWFRVCLPCGRPGFDPWVGKIPWRRAWQPILVFLPGESPLTEVPGRLQPCRIAEHTLQPCPDRDHKHWSCPVAEHRLWLNPAREPGQSAPPKHRARSPFPSSYEAQREALPESGAQSVTSPSSIGEPIDFLLKELAVPSSIELQPADPTGCKAQPENTSEYKS